MIMSTTAIKEPGKLQIEKLLQKPQNSCLYHLTHSFSCLPCKYNSRNTTPRRKLIQLLWVFAHFAVSAPSLFIFIICSYRFPPEINLSFCPCSSASLHLFRCSNSSCTISQLHAFHVKGCTYVDKKRKEKRGQRKDRPICSHWPFNFIIFSSAP